MAILTKGISMVVKDTPAANLFASSGFVPVVRVEEGDGAAALAAMRSLYGKDVAEKLIVRERARKKDFGHATPEEAAARCFDGGLLDALFDRSLVRFANSLDFGSRVEAQLVGSAYEWLALRGPADVAEKKAALERIADLASQRRLQEEEVRAILKACGEPGIGPGVAASDRFVSAMRAVLLSRYRAAQRGNRAPADVDAIAEGCGLDAETAGRAVWALWTQDLMLCADGAAYAISGFEAADGREGFDPLYKGRLVAEAIIADLQRGAVSEILRHEYDAMTSRELADLLETLARLAQDPPKAEACIKERIISALVEIVEKLGEASRYVPPFF